VVRKGAVVLGNDNKHLSKDKNLHPKKKKKQKLIAVKYTFLLSLLKKKKNK